jgi:hypothetical protein
VGLHGFVFRSQPRSVPIRVALPLRLAADSQMWILHLQLVLPLMVERACRAALDALHRTGRLIVAKRVRACPDWIGHEMRGRWESNARPKFGKFLNVLASRRRQPYKSHRQTFGPIPSPGTIRTSGIIASRDAPFLLFSVPVCMPVHGSIHRGTDRRKQPVSATSRPSLPQNHVPISEATCDLSRVVGPSLGRTVCFAGGR